MGCSLSSKASAARHETGRGLVKLQNTDKKCLVPATYRKKRLRKKFPLVLDTGANRSLMPLRIVKKCRLVKDIRPTSLSVHYGPYPTNGLVAVTLSLGKGTGKVQVTHTFMVTEKMDYCLLGRDFLRGFSCKVFLNRKDPHMTLERQARPAGPD